MPGSPVITGLRYADAPAAIRFLCQAFGCEVQASYVDADDPHIRHHAPRVRGEGMGWLGCARDGVAESRSRWTTPRVGGGVGTRS